MKNSIALVRCGGKQVVKLASIAGLVGLVGAGQASRNDRLRRGPSATDDVRSVPTELVRGRVWSALCDVVLARHL